MAGLGLGFDTGAAPYTLYFSHSVLPIGGEKRFERFITIGTTRSIWREHLARGF